MGHQLNIIPQMNTSNVVDSTLKRNMRYSMLDAFFFAMMSGAGEGYFVAFALELGIAPLKAGLLGTLPLFFGGTFQLFFPKILEKLSSYNRFTYLACSVQALTFLPLVAFAFLKFSNFYLLLALNSIYWIMAYGLNQSWNAMISGLIPPDMRLSFFSKRSMLIYVGMFIGVITSGIALEYSRIRHISIYCFGIVFLFCMLFRLVSAFFLKKHSLVVMEDKEKNIFKKNIFEKFKNRTPKGMGNILLFVFFFRIAIYFSAPFFIPFMIKELKLSYFAFMGIISASIIGKIIIAKSLNRIAIKYNLNRIFFISCVCICFIPLGWVFLSKSTLYLIILEIFSGMFWGGFEYSIFIMIINEIPRNFQARYMSIYNFIIAIAIITGSLFGGYIFSHINFLYGPYSLIFSLSTIGRLMSLLFYPKIFDRIHIPKRHIFTKPLSIRPGQGTVDRPIIFKKN